MTLTLRYADRQDIPAIKTLMDRSIRELQKGYLTDEQIEASFAGMGLDTQLIDDQTYFCVLSDTPDDSRIVGCGGWSFRATLYGGNHTGGRSARELDPKTERARIRAMYTDPDFARRGIGKMIIDASEKAAKKAGFRALEMAATTAGRPFYERCGYHVEADLIDDHGAEPVPLFTMVKTL